VVEVDPRRPEVLLDDVLPQGGGVALEGGARLPEGVGYRGCS
jgi:hypothetical protein